MGRRRTEDDRDQGRTRPLGSLCLRPHLFHATRTVAWAAERARMRKDGYRWKASLSASMSPKTNWTSQFFLPKRFFLSLAIAKDWITWSDALLGCRQSSSSWKRQAASKQLWPRHWLPLGCLWLWSIHSASELLPRPWDVWQRPIGSMLKRLHSMAKRSK